ncbi:MAG: hypothetical protein IT319_09955 [Anaerolineae bacterium]|nr:hypothetical protein [Anaerolineae bacterium]
MNRQQHTNRSLASVAGISEGAVRNILRHGVNSTSKDPDPHTLTKLAQALDVEPLYLFRLAGYIPPEPDARSIRAEYLAEVFDRLSSEKQDAVLAVVEAMTAEKADRDSIQQMRQRSSDALAGIDLSFPGILRVIANDLIVRYEMREPPDVDRIKPDVEVLQNRWDALPLATRERIKALIRRKLSLNYDATMVDEHWRT